MKLGDADSIFKDDRALYEVTINNQLYLLMLIEDLELAGFRVISANTDGVTALVPKDKLEAYYNVLKDWSSRTRFTLEVNNYDLYVRTSVNHYIAVVNNGDGITVKAKGEFDKNLYKQLNTGYYAPIIAQAVENYYVHDKAVEDTIYNATDILDFCITQKTGSNFVNEYHVLNVQTNKTDIDILTKQLRYYVSASGGIILKRKKDTGKLTNILKGQYVRLLHKLENRNMEDYDINYNFYINKAKDLIHVRVNNAQTKVMKKTTGTLFDYLDNYETI